MAISTAWVRAATGSAILTALRRKHASLLSPLNVRMKVSANANPDEAANRESGRIMWTALHSKTILKRA